MASKASGTLAGAGSGAAAGAMIGSVVPGIGTAIGAVGGAVIGGMIGLFSSNDDEHEKAQQAAQSALDEILSINAPPDTARAILLEHFQSAGLYHPQLEQKAAEASNAYAQIQTDPKLKQAQMSALESFQKLSQTGLTPQERAEAEQNLLDANRLGQQKVQQIQQNFQRQGLGGGGSDLAAQLSAAQSGANSAQQGALGISAQAAQARQNALGQYLSGATSVEQQQFGEEAQKANAANELQRFNITNQMGINQRNTAAANQGQVYNLQNQQGIMNANTSMNNQEQLRERQAELTDWQNQVQRAQMRSGAYQGQYGVHNANQERQEKEQSAMINALPVAAKGISGGMGGAGGFSGPTTKATGTYSSDQQYDTSRGPLAPSYWQGGYVHGGQVSGEAKHEENNPENDTVNAKLSPGEIVVPKEESKHLETAYEFIKHLLSKK